MTGKGTTFQGQAQLPSLPVPSLQETAVRLLATVEPLARPGTDDFVSFENLVKDFVKVGGQGETLQQRLQGRQKEMEKDKKSWLEDWWLSLAYLSWRSPVLVHSNWYILAQPHPQAGRGLNNLQTLRAAGFISSFLDYKELLDSESLPPESTKAGPLCMHQYTKLFGITRVPKSGTDILVGDHPAKARHILVIYQDQLFVVDVFESKTGARVSISSIERQLERVIHQVTSEPVKEPPIGLLTGTHRDTWADLHGHLCQLSSKNRESFGLIETALFAVALDDRLYTDVDAFARNTFHAFNGHNRWFDKALTIVVTKDGMLGLNGEHSPCDALVPAMLVDYAVAREPATDPAGVKHHPTMNAPRKLQWTIDDKITKGLADAQVFINALISDSDVGVLHYKGYGSSFIKEMAKVSPDAYMQICIQMTYYRIHQKLAATYETASTRKYLHGRTETCRSLSTPMAQFGKIFDSSTIPLSDKLAAFQKAAYAHVDYLKVASDGKGVDRHLLGLRLLYLPGEDKHPLFSHRLFTESGTWLLSTSALFSGERVWGTGFGAVVRFTLL